MGKHLVGVARVLLLCAVVLVLPAVTASQSPPPPPPPPPELEPELPPELQPTPLTFNVPATAVWVDTGLDVVASDLLEVQAVGTWTDGGSTSGPEGSANPWPDNFLNLTDLGACSVCARTLTEGHGALVGYIGDSPPAAGSYTSTAVRSEAVKIFYIGANFRGNVPSDGRLWLNKNADAYSGYTLDNSGSVTATVTATTESTGSGQPPKITLLGSDPLQHTQGCPFVGAGAIATDPEDGDLTHAIIITGTENLDSPGPQTLTYSVTDSEGLSDVETRQVVVFGVVGTPGCLLGKPEGKAPNLIVIVHGCCTDAADVGTLGTQFSEAYKGQAFLQENGGWEIVVRDWSAHTPKDCINMKDCADQAYIYARDFGGRELKDAIVQYPEYKYVHLIAHSAGVNLIDVASKELKLDYLKIENTEERPFIHLTFLDAYTPDDSDKDAYGFLSGYPNHYIEHYVDRTFSEIPDWIVMTNTILPYAFNFDITNWQTDNPDERENFGHEWPRHWYIKSITATAPGFEFLKYGHPLSLEGGDDQFINVMGQLYQPPSSKPSDPSRGLITLIYPPPEGVPVITEIVFPSSIPADGVPVIGTVKFTDSNKGVIRAQFDVLGDTCGGCFLPFPLEVSALENENGEFDFEVLCSGSLNYWTMKLALLDIEDNVSNPYTFSVECKP